MNSYLIVFGIILAFSLVSGKSIQRLMVKKVIVDVNPNPYVKSAHVKINGKYNDTVTIEMPIYKELPDDIILNNYIVYNGEPIPAMRGELCDLFDDQMFAPDVLDAGVPKDKFPRKCPVLPNEDYVIRDYIFSSEKIPPGVPDGEISSDIYVSHNGDDSKAFLIIRSESLLRTDILDASSLMG